MRFYCNPVPVLTVTSIALDSTGNTATLTTSQPLPKSGCFNLRIAGAPCCVKINPCATEQVIVTDGTTTYSNVYGRCGNYLQLGQIAGNVRRWNCLHFAVTTNPAGNLQCLDKLCAPQVGPDVVSGVTVTSTPAAASAMTAF
ncbi:hypothetical protein AB9L11_00780 [Desulfovibrio piger]